MLDPHTLFAPHFRNALGVVVAVSGGPDSMALLHMLSQWKKHPRLCVATVDHGLRTEAANEAQMVAAYARELNLEHATLAWRGPRPEAGIQEAAREMRYQLLAHHALETNCSHLVTAHHADDQAETVLLRLIAGSGIAGLAAMAMEIKRDFALHVRPLLHFTKSELVAYCHQHGVPCISDPSNTDNRYARTRIRKLMVALEVEGLTRQRLCKLAERASRANDALDATADLALNAAYIKTSTDLVRINWSGISQQPAEIRLRSLISILDSARRSKEPMRLERVETLEEQITTAHRKRQPLRKSLADRIVSLDVHGVLSITPAPPRIRGLMKR
jgi:tRNA(Ile)-lysidine synthase